MYLCVWYTPPPTHTHLIPLLSVSIILHFLEKDYKFESKKQVCVVCYSGDLSKVKQLNSFSLKTPY